MATFFTIVSGLLFEGFTTTERDALNAQEGLVVRNTTTQRLEIYLSGAWYGFLRLDADGRISSVQHGSLGNDLHSEYARTAAPEEITTAWMLKSGGSLKATAGDPPEGEVLGQVKNTTGAPTHSASAGVHCWVLPDADEYINNDGGTSWTKQAKDSSLPTVSFHTYVFVPDAAQGDDVAIGDAQGVHHHSLDNGETVHAWYIDAETAPTGAAIIVQLEYGNTDDLDTVASWTEIDRDDLAISAKSVKFTSGFTNGSIPANRLIRMNVDQVGSTVAGKDAAVHLVVKRPLTT